VSTATPASPPDAPLPDAIGKSVLLLSLACFTSMASQRICDAMLPELSRQFDSPLAATAQVVSAFALTYGLTQLFFGSLGDRYGKLRVIAYTLLGSAAGNVLAALAPSLDLLVAARVLAAACAAAIIPLALAWTGDAVPYARRQETLARVGLGTTMGIFSGQFIGGLITDTVGWRWAFALLTVLFLLMGILVQLHRRDHQVAVAAPAAGGVSLMAQTRELLRDGWVRKMLGFSLLQGAAGFGMMALVASHLHQLHGLSLSSAGAIVALMGLGGVSFMATAKHVIARLGESGMALMGGLGMALALVVLALSPWWPITPLAMLLGGFFFFMLHNTLQALATQMAPQARGVGVSMFATTLFLGQALGVALAAALIDRVGSALVLCGAAGVMLAIGTMLHLQLRKRARALAVGAPPAARH
jgi:predicted MFS family arabinose efflux permease